MIHYYLIGTTTGWGLGATGYATGCATALPAMPGLLPSRYRLLCGIPDTGVACFYFVYFFLFILAHILSSKVLSAMLLARPL